MATQEQVVLVLHFSIQFDCNIYTLLLCVFQPHLSAYDSGRGEVFSLLCVSVKN